MNGFISKAKLLGCLAVGAIAASGCIETYNQLVDPCWPHRYGAKSREEVEYYRNTQVENGLVLEQSLWNYHFQPKPNGDPGDQLTPAAQALLDRVARRRPATIPDMFLQTAHDIRFVEGKPEEFVAARTDLDARRVKAVEQYMAAARPDVKFTVTVHDPGVVGMSAREAASSVLIMQTTPVGTLGGGSGGGASGGSGGGK